MLRIIPAIVALLLAVAVLTTSAPPSSAYVPPTGTSRIESPSPPCVEDAPSMCWVWSTMGNRKRGVRLHGTRYVVGPCAYARMWDRASRRVKRALRAQYLRGDGYARRLGCIGNVLLF
jgi:hypothetical protein